MGLDTQWDREITRAATRIDPAYVLNQNITPVKLNANVLKSFSETGCFVTFPEHRAFSRILQIREVISRVLTANDS